MTLVTQPTNEHGRLLKGLNGKNLVTKKIKSALDTFENVIGGREKLVDLLSLATLDKKGQHLLRLLDDSDHSNRSLAIIVREAGLTPAQALELFKASSLAASHAIVSSQLSDALPAVVKDITDKSVDSWVQCPTCKGESSVTDAVPCFTCQGKGEIFRPSDLDRQKIVLEATGVTKKGGGVNVNVQQNNVNGTPANFFSKFVKNSDEAAYSIESDVIDAEVTSPKDTDGT